MDDFVNDLKNLKKDFQNNKIFKNAINGNTDIECFNDWVIELKKQDIFIITLECGFHLFGFLHWIYLAIRSRIFYEIS